MSTIKIEHRFTAAVLLSLELDTLCGADLRGVDLSGADLRGVKWIFSKVEE